MHGVRNLNGVFQERKAKPRRIPTTGLTVGSWKLEESPDGHLQVTNLETGASTILAFREEQEQSSADGSD